MRPTWRARALVSGLTATVTVLLAGAATAGAATITVNDAGDTAADDGFCTLREAINAASNDAASGVTAGECAAGQAAPTRDVIVFSIGVAGSVQTITLGASGNLPPVDTGPLEIDGRNGAAPPPVVFPRIEIDATTAVGAGLVLTQGADGSFIHHLAIYDAGNDGIRIQNDDNQLSNLVIGLDLAGTDHPNGGNGVEVRGADNVITTSVISANAGNGIDIGDDDLFNPTTGTAISGTRIRHRPAWNWRPRQHDRWDRRLRLAGDRERNDDWRDRGSDPRRRLHRRLQRHLRQRQRRDRAQHVDGAEPARRAGYPRKLRRHRHGGHRGDCECHGGHAPAGQHRRGRGA